MINHQMYLKNQQQQQFKGSKNMEHRTNNSEYYLSRTTGLCT
jgi:hypothetical protein